MDAAPDTVLPDDGQPDDIQRCPAPLRTAAAWSWRLLLVGTAVYVAWRVARVLYVVVVPCAAALLITALLQPAVSWLRRHGWPAMAATWCTLLGVAVLLTGLGLLVSDRVSAEYPKLVADTRRTVTRIENWLAGPPFRITGSNAQKFLNDIPRFLSQHKALVEGTVVTGGRIAVELVAGLVLMMFVTFFLLKARSRSPRSTPSLSASRCGSWTCRWCCRRRCWCSSPRSSRW
jgi:predicted PurR-regulated permease PerM